ncbi:nucleotidyltransferase family protein [Erythrobacter ani]|uniref:Nucleotidyltransferase family protein n=1 Tax=Erythrobacter ani TaxID=2827235 RepID=A0ABS6SK76_9SPHN|nr:nucleotidyltransferase family protein [Erythrobacter ani]MBV7265377.1 nucleotidyltransferase family protein [Erythrobacter ani]
MDGASRVREVLRNDPVRRKALELVADLNLPDCWIAAGFVRDAVWDRLHGYPMSEPYGDVDVVWFCDNSQDDDDDRLIERRLVTNMPELEWSVKNQARMHRRNADYPYRSVADAMTYWPETATAIAARLDGAGEIQITAPFGLEDLLTLRLRPGPRFWDEKLPIFVERVGHKNWTKRYPKLKMSVVASGGSSLSR